VPYIVVGILILALVTYAAVYVSYQAFVATMSIVSVVSNQPVV
jgi:hypothetical protein